MSEKPSPSASPMVGQQKVTPSRSDPGERLNKIPLTKVDISKYAITTKNRTKPKPKPKLQLPAKPNPS